MLAELRKAGAALKLHLVEQAVTDQADIERGFGSLQPGDVEGVFVLSPNLQVKFSALLIRLTAEHGLPLLGYRKEWVQRDALFSYSPDIRAIGKTPSKPRPRAGLSSKRIDQIMNLGRTQLKRRLIAFWDEIDL